MFSPSNSAYTRTFISAGEVVPLVQQYNAGRQEKAGRERGSKVREECNIIDIRK